LRSFCIFEMIMCTSKSYEHMNFHISMQASYFWVCRMLPELDMQMVFQSILLSTALACMHGKCQMLHIK